MRFPILKDNSIGLIKWEKRGLENLHGSPSIKRRIRWRAIRDYRRGEHKNPPYPFNVAPTNVHSKIVLKGDDSCLKYA
jgi:hypothetical protein